MEALTQLFDLDVAEIIIGLVIILLAIKYVIELLQWFANRFGIELKWLRNKNEDHALLISTTEELHKLQEEHAESVCQSIKHDKKLEESIVALTDTVNKIDEKLDSVQDMCERSIVASRESLGDRISQKYRYYINNNGIPEDEYDEFLALHSAYHNCGGNHTGDLKFNYCINNLQILPSENKK